MIATLRRYLQPSPVMRWHPWAPLAALLLAVAAAFALGVAWGVRQLELMNADEVYMRAFMTQAYVMQEKRGPVVPLLREARSIDDAVIRFASHSDNRLWPFDVAAVRWGQKTDSIRNLAEFRLANLGGSATRWQPTSSYCAGGVPSSGEDVRESYRAPALAYSKVLGRQVTTEQLAPVVPGWRCTK